MIIWLLASHRMFLLFIWLIYPPPLSVIDISRWGQLHTSVVGKEGSIIIVVSGAKWSGRLMRMDDSLMLLALPEQQFTLCVVVGVIKPQDG